MAAKLQAARRAVELGVARVRIGNIDGDPVRDGGNGDHTFSNNGLTMATITTATPPEREALLGLYKRAPIELVRGEGVELFDADGSGVPRFHQRHRRQRVRLRAMLDCARPCTPPSNGLIHVSNLFRTAPGEQLAARLVELSFADKVFFCNSGAEANEGAFKFARKWARTTVGAAKTDIIALRGAFHGRLFASLAATDRPSYRAPFRPLAGGVSIVERDIEDLAIVLDAETVAAVILEPVQGEGGVRVLDHGFIRELRALTRERKVALIFDEIQCGMGRTGSLFAYEQIGVEPDMLTLAKPIAGGLPMGAVLLNERIAATMNAGDHGTTFGGGPFVASVALHVLERIADPSLLAHVQSRRQLARLGTPSDERSHWPCPCGSRRRVHVGHRRR